MKAKSTALAPGRVLERLEALTCKVRECLNEDCVYCPTEADFETLREAVLMLEPKAKVEPKKEKKADWEKLPHGMGQNEAYAMSREYMEAMEKSRIREELRELRQEAKKGIYGGLMGSGMGGIHGLYQKDTTLDHSLHSEQGRKYGCKMIDAYHFGLQKANFQGEPTIYVGADHAESFRHYLMDQTGSYRADTDGKVTRWSGLPIRRTATRESWVQWDEGECSYLVNIETPNKIHRTTRTKLLADAPFK